MAGNSFTKSLTLWFTLRARESCVVLWARPWAITHDVQIHRDIKPNNIFIGMLSHRR
jgi:serine/threonine protein kinase